MKKFLFILTIACMWGCMVNKIDDIDITPLNENFVSQVPADFSWSPILQKEINVTVMHGNVKSGALNNTLVELYNQNNELIDALTIIDGVASFNVRIPAATSKLTLIAVAAKTKKEISTDQSNILLEIPDILAMSFTHVDSDNDGLYDEFDAEPFNAYTSVKIGNVSNSDGLKSTNVVMTANYTYTIFEDLWPSLGDYDYNDIVVKTNFSWVRGKCNYITQIDGVCNVECIGTSMGLGLGYELFAANDVNLSYLNDIILQVNGAEKDKSVTNGIIAFYKVQNVGKGEIKFTITLKDKEIKDFVSIPYLFRTDDYNHQIRPYGAPPTRSQEMLHFNTYDDDSPTKWEWITGNKFTYPLSGINAFFRSEENFPWGIEFIANSFKPSPEKTLITSAYPGFRTWAESGGQKEKDWYNYPN